MKRQRHSQRLRGWDYASSAAYFVTICAFRRERLFGTIENQAVHFSEAGEIVKSRWLELPNHFPNLEIDTFVVMPNHVHGIVWILPKIPTRTPDDVGAQHAAPLHRIASPNFQVKRGSLGAIVRSFKSATTKRINETRGSSIVPIWQRNYFDAIIRDDAHLEQTRLYIENNPVRWLEDDLYANGVAA